MDIQQLYRFSDKGISPAQEDITPLRNLVDAYPYFQLPLFVYLKALYLFEHSTFQSELAHRSIFIGDRRALYYYILSEEYALLFEHTGKKDISEDKTSLLLNAFFDSRGDDDMSSELEYTISHSSLATTDYFTYMQVTADAEPVAEDTDTSSLKHQSIIDTFISRSESEEGIRIQVQGEDVLPVVAETESNDEELDEDMFFTETLAKIYIKQKKYEKAYKIIKHLSLNYPKKNIYFADQLSFLEKLIINSKFKDTK